MSCGLFNLIVFHIIMIGLILIIGILIGHHSDQKTEQNEGDCDTV